MELINQIVARMKAEGATSASIDEINRCLSGCTSSKKLIKYALENRLNLCFRFCGADERSDGEMILSCGCNMLYENKKQQ